MSAARKWTERCPGVKGVSMRWVRLILQTMEETTPETEIVVYVKVKEYQENIHVKRRKKK
jgi:hypothetical protein